MRGVVIAMTLCVVMLGCDDARVFEQYKDFPEKQWVVSDQPEFEFEVNDTATAYNIYCNLRNAESYPLSDFRFTYYLQDSTGAVLEKKLVTEYLFDRKTGKPFGSSGLGDIYDHQFPIIEDHTFSRYGKFKIRLEQYMRKDTLDGILAVGVRVEKVMK